MARPSVKHCGKSPAERFQAPQLSATAKRAAFYPCLSNLIKCINVFEFNADLELDMSAIQAVGGGGAENHTRNIKGAL